MKAINYRNAIKNILQHVYVENDHLFYINGRAFPVTQRSAYAQWNKPMSSFGENTGDDNLQREKLIADLAGNIYSVFYVSGNPNGEWFDETIRVSPEEKNAFMNELSEANQTREVWDPLWTVTSTDPSGNVSVYKNGITRPLVHNEWKPMQQLNGALQPGMTLTLLTRKERRDAQPVFYYVYGQEFMPYSLSMVRFYFNLKPAAVAGFIGDLTSSFNKLKLPFMFKCLNHPSLYSRTDASVLYIEKSRFTITARLLGSILKKHAASFNPAVPLFSKRISPGVSFAEDPGNGKSFGMFWSGLLAEGIVKIYEQGITDNAKKEHLVFDLIKKKGVHPEAAHLRANSFFPYDFSLLQ